jgi:hypothetical protein
MKRKKSGCGNPDNGCDWPFWCGGSKVAISSVVLGILKAEFLSSFLERSL